MSRAVGLLRARDDAIWAHAKQNDAILLTKDEDFAARSMRSEAAPVIVWLRVGNTTNPALRAWFGSRLPSVVRLIEQVIV